MKSNPNRQSALLSQRTSADIATALDRLDTWIESQNFCGWDPHDALNSRLLKFVAGRSRPLGIATLQLLRRSPVNLRSLLGVRKGHNPKAMGLFLNSYALKFVATGNQEFRRKAVFFASWLLEHTTQDYAGPCWGYNFDWPNRGLVAPAGTPTIVNTSFIALAFLEAEAILRFRGERSSQNEIDPISIARGACEFLIRDLNILRSAPDELCFSYTPGDQRFVHNANLLGAWLLAAVYEKTGEREIAAYAKSAARFTVARQRSDGSWPYGITENDKWVDNFHTGFILVALRRIGQLLHSDEFDSALEIGYRFWKERMFLNEIVPKYYPTRTYPIDVHSVAQAILTFLAFSEFDREALENAGRLCSWAVEHMQDEAGFFHYQIHRWHRVRIPYMRWGQAWMQLALTKFVYNEATSNSGCVGTFEKADAL